MVMNKIIKLIAVAVLSLSPLATNAQPSNPYELPDPLRMENGKEVRNRRQWNKIRRPELMELLRSQMFGREPGQAPELHFETLEESKDVFGGLATRKQVKISFDKDENYHLVLLMYIPNDRKGPVPAFLGANFKGNHATTDDPAVLCRHPRNWPPMLRVTRFLRETPTVTAGNTNISLSTAMR